MEFWECVNLIYIIVFQVDTMVIQAIGLLDDLDKELNTYAMRVREWYGWHFPELAKIVQDNIAYAKAVKLMGFRVDAAKLDFSEVIVYFASVIIIPSPMGFQCIDYISAIEFFS